ncbi:MAG TPA: hypothetical protein VHP37_12090 [Burkholderiales bacterium]|nr:hypothetical protein [Burkholderiales bacterium]
MKSIFVALVAALAAAGSAWGADNLGEQEAAELRQRAQEFQNLRERDPEFQPGEGRSAPEPERASGKRAKKHAARTTAPVKQTPAKEPLDKKAKRSLKNIPGAFVRK